MKKLALLLPLLFLMGCSKDNPLSPEELSNLSYLGGNNTVRVYETTEWMFKPNTDIPYIKIPDYLAGRITFDTALSNQGIYAVYKTSETLIPYSQANSGEEGHMLKIYSESRNLQVEIDNLNKNIKYDPVGFEYTDETELIEDKNGVYERVNDNNENKILKKPLFVGQNWIREKRTYLNDAGVAERFQQECRVIGREYVETKARKFYAYKVQVTDDWVDLNSKLVEKYEYYVPGVGLVLSESDGNMYQATAVGNGSTTIIYVRMKERKELLSYNFK